MSRRKILSITLLAIGLVAPFIAGQSVSALVAPTWIVRPIGSEATYRPMAVATSDSGSVAYVVRARCTLNLARKIEFGSATCSFACRRTPPSLSGSVPVLPTLTGTAAACGSSYFCALLRSTPQPWYSAQAQRRGHALRKHPRTARCNPTE